jgi:hypothetical protein
MCVKQHVFMSHQILLCIAFAARCPPRQAVQCVRLIVAEIQALGTSEKVVSLNLGARIAGLKALHGCNAITESSLSCWKSSQ